MKRNEPEKNSSHRFKLNLPENFEFPNSAVGRRLLEEYGALFVAQSDVIVPETVIFKDEKEVWNWQGKVPNAKMNLGGFEIELQTAALKKLKKAVAEAEENNLTITPRGADSARRNYAQTVDLWASRVNPALIHWVKEGKLSETTADEIRALPAFEQVPEIFRLEAEGVFFSKDLSKSIIYSVAPPGASQHLAMLALDVAEYNDALVRKILAKHGWFQTVVSDLPHFTYLGAPENELENLGLKKVANDDRIFWIPNL
ncbi:MAG: hypothetical protein M3033_08525 [Acidobacteriota bacterium]|nr:hypothetical protein [Acidobacteriota bacterium]